jgi:hypothetical protein
MTTKTTRYDFENLPISQKTRDGLTSENINYLSAVGRMLSLQDDVYDDKFEEIIKLIKDQTAEFNRRFDSIDRRLDSLERGATDREKRIEYLEQRASLPYMIFRYGVVIGIGILIGWLLHSL